jgi:hypothetical protein
MDYFLLLVVLAVHSASMVWLKMDYLQHVVVALVLQLELAA